MNANPSATTGISPFLITNRYELRISFDLQSEPIPFLPKDSREATERLRAEQLAKSVQDRS
jgi:hypothetical protein